MLLKGPIEAQDEGVRLADVDTLDFAGAGVSAAVSGKKATVTIPGASGVTFDPSTTVEIYDDFIGGALETGEIGELGWQSQASGGAVTAAPAADAAHPGTIFATTFTSSTGRVGYELFSLGSANCTIIIGGGAIVVEACINLVDLSAVAEEYDFYFGIADNTAGGNMTNGCYFHYDRNTSTNWLRSTGAGGSLTETSTGIAVATGWTKLRIEINAAGTSAEFFVNGVSGGTNSTNMPTIRIWPIWKIEKSAGTTARLAGFDYFYFHQDLTTAR